MIKTHTWMVLLVALAVAMPGAGYASTKSKQAAASQSAKSKLKHSKSKPAKRAAAPAPKPFSALVIDASTGRVLFEKNADAVRYPASLTKMMTLYLAFDALKKGKLRMDENLYVSAKAAGQPATNISLDAGDRVSVRTAIESLVVRSANDSAMVLGEAIGDTEFNFALMMTQKARALGMKNTVFRNPSGLPDTKQQTTALDMARLALALRRDFPEYYPFFKMTSFTHNGITYPGHNHVMERYPGVDGVKTGYIRASGYNLVTSAEKNGKRIVAVVLGGQTISSRDSQMVSLLDDAFDKLDNQKKDVAGGNAENDNEEIPAVSLTEPEAPLAATHG